MKLPAALLPLLLFSAPSAAATLSGRVVKVVGDTVYVLDATKKQHKIRLAGIDAPERKQPFRKKAKEYLSNLIAAKDVQVEWSERDRYQRIIGKVILGGQDANLAMVRAGLAWWYRRYANEQNPGDRVLYEAAENQAKAELRGLWADSDPIPPWVWRHR